MGTISAGTGTALLVLGPAQGIGDLRKFVVSRKGAARYVVVLRDEPTGAPAITAFGRDTAMLKAR